MKSAFLCGIALVCSSAAFAQTPAAPGSTMRPTVTLSGCVVGGGVNQPITLANAMVVPTAAEASTAATTPSPVPGAVSSSPTQLPITAGESGAAGTSSTAATGTTTATAGTAGTSVTAGTPGPLGTTGTVTGTAPAGSSASSASGYRLSGNDMTSWVGRRVQIVGLIVPPSGTTSAAPGGAATPRSTPTTPELRVVSVQPITGDCPQK
jgi:hypothetical protein